MEFNDRKPGTDEELLALANAVGSTNEKKTTSRMSKIVLGALALIMAIGGGKVVKNNLDGPDYVGVTCSKVTKTDGEGLDQFLYENVEGADKVNPGQLREVVYDMNTGKLLEQTGLIPGVTICYPSKVSK